MLARIQLSTGRNAVSVARFSEDWSFIGGTVHNPNAPHHAMTFDEMAQMIDSELGNAHYSFGDAPLRRAQGPPQGGVLSEPLGAAVMGARARELRLDCDFRSRRGTPCGDLRDDQALATLLLVDDMVGLGMILFTDSSNIPE